MTKNKSQITVVVGEPIDFDDVGKKEYSKREGGLSSYYIEPRFNTGIVVNSSNLTTRILQAEIEAKVKIPFSRFMDVSLYGEDGYYKRGKVQIGERKDFITSPEASKIFGWGNCLLAYKLWEAMNRPGKFEIVEEGAGYASLSSSLLDLAQVYFPDFYDSIQYSIVEHGEYLIPSQRDKLKTHLSKVQWIKGSAYEHKLGSIEGLILSNELPDAFPAERVIRINGEIKQKYVTIEDENWVEVWDAPTQKILDFINIYNIKIEDGVEEPINPQSVRWMELISNSLKRGAIMTIDYGAMGEVGNWNTPAVRYYRNLREDRVVGNDGENLLAPYRFPGSVDITTSVNFRPMKQVGESYGLTSIFESYQKDLFLNVGIAQLLKRKVAEFDQLTRWEEVEAFDASLDGYIDIMYEMGGYFAQVMVKGVNPEKTKWETPDKDYRPILPVVTFDLGYEYGEVIADLRGNKKWGAYIPQSRKIEGKMISLFPSQISGTVIYKAKGNEERTEWGYIVLTDLSQHEVIYDFRNLDTRKILLAQAGYTL